MFTQSRLLTELLLVMCLLSLSTRAGHLPRVVSTKTNELLKRGTVTTPASPSATKDPPKTMPVIQPTERGCNAPYTAWGPCLEQAKYFLSVDKDMASTAASNFCDFVDQTTTILPSATPRTCPGGSEAGCPVQNPSRDYSIRFDYQASWIDGCTDVPEMVIDRINCTEFVLDTWQGCKEENQGSGGWKATGCVNVTMNPLCVWA